MPTNFKPVRLQNSNDNPKYNYSRTAEIKENISEAAKEKKHIFFKETTIRLTADFLAETMVEEKQNDTLKGWHHNNLKEKNSITEKIILLKMQVRIKTFVRSEEKKIL